MSKDLFNLCSPLNKHKSQILENYDDKREIELITKVCNGTT